MGIKMKTFLLFVALICATTTAIPTPTNVNGESLSAFLTNLKEAIKSSTENLLAMIQRFENEELTPSTTTSSTTTTSTTTPETTIANDQSIPRILVVTGYGDSQK